MAAEQLQKSDSKLKLCTVSGSMVFSIHLVYSTLDASDGAIGKYRVRFEQSSIGFCCLPLPDSPDGC